MTTLAATVNELSDRLARLEQRSTCCRGDWVRLDAAVTAAALAARHELGGASPEECEREMLYDLLDELRYIKLCAQSRIAL